MKTLNRIILINLKIIILITALIITNISYANNAFSATNSKYSSLVMDAKTGEIIHHVNGYKKRYPASLTKMMTLYILFDEIKRGSIKKTDLIYFSKRAHDQHRSTHANEHRQAPLGRCHSRPLRHLLLQIFEH